jgi:hypothetical protein
MADLDRRPAQGRVLASQTGAGDLVATSEIVFSRR